MGPRILSLDPARKADTLFHADDAAGTFTLESRQDVTDLMASNAEEFNAAGDARTGEFHKVASIPLNIYMELKRKGVIDDPKRFKAWLNDRDNRAWRTAPGRV